MFYAGTKIVVICSNVTRKAGPRAGSIGYVLSTGGATMGAGSTLVFARVLFTRYGYEAEGRSEIKKVFLAGPAMKTQYDEPGAVYRYVKYIKGMTEDYPVMLVDNIPSDPNDIHNTVAIMMAKFRSQNVVRLLDAMMMNETDEDSMPTFDNIRPFMPKDILTFSRVCMTETDISKVKMILEETYTKKDYSNILRFLSTIESQTAIYDGRVGPGASLSSIVQSLYKPYELMQKLNGGKPLETLPKHVLSIIRPLLDFKKAVKETRLKVIKNQ